MAPSIRPRSIRIARKQISYHQESSHDEGNSHNGSELDLPRPPSRRPQPPAKRKTLNQRPFASAKRARTGLQTRERAEQSRRKDKEVDIKMTGKAMPWGTLPYHVLESIFCYASYPLITDTFTPTSSIAWLLKVALLCKSFTAPAISALHYAPPLSPPSRARALMSHLESQSESSAFNYRAKVKYLDMEAVATLVRKYEGQDPIDLIRLVQLTPQLRGLEIHLLSDNPKWHKRTRLVGGSKAVYPQMMFSSLEDTNVALKEWIWNASLAGPSFLSDLKQIHRSPFFLSLQRLSFVDCEAPKPEANNGSANTPEDRLAEGLSVLPVLKHLSIRMSPMVNERLMPMLPADLESLEIVDCRNLESPVMSMFLNHKGRNFRKLILDHNQCLDLSFLTDLESACPRLEILKMDLIYYNTHFTFRNSEPHYAALLLANQRPTWPSSLQHLELLYLRKWSLEAAETFLSSLTESAETLPNLRQLKIKASLQESGWRDRVAFRDKWTQSLKQVFLRVPPPPAQHLESFAAFKAFKAHQKKRLHSNGQSTNTGIPLGVNRPKDAQLSHVAIPRKSVKKSHETNTDVPLVNVRRSIRPGVQKDGRYDLADNSPSKTPTRRRRRRRRRRADDGSSSEDSALDDDGIDLDTQQSSVRAEEPQFIQGLCDVVDVLIDNLRPTEEQLKEDDFLDDEISGDEDWNGEDDIPGDGGYAW